MDMIKIKSKKGLIIKTWERCTSFSSIGRKTHAAKLKSKSWPRSNSTVEVNVRGDCNDHKSCRVAPPVGCFSVYVGTQKQRFVVKTNLLNHPLFVELLEEAELEYGFNNDGPLELPCEVDHFLGVLMEIDGDHIRPGCSFGKKNGPRHFVTPPKYFSSNTF